MSIFSKKKNFSEENEYFDTLFGGDSSKQQSEKPPITSWEEKEKNIRAPHALTADELNSHSQNNKPQEFSGSLFEKVLKDADKPHTEKPAPHIPAHRITAEDITANRISAADIAAKAAEKTVYKPKSAVREPDKSDISKLFFESVTENTENTATIKHTGEAKKAEPAPSANAAKPAEAPNKENFAPRAEPVKIQMQTKSEITMKNSDAADLNVQNIKREFKITKPEEIPMAPKSSAYTPRKTAEATDSDLTSLLEKCSNFINETNDSDGGTDTQKSTADEKANRPHINYSAAEEKPQPNTAAQTATPQITEPTAAEKPKAQPQNAPQTEILQPNQKKKIPVKLKIMTPSADDSIIKTEEETPISKAPDFAKAPTETEEKSTKPQTSITDTTVFDALIQSASEIPENSDIPAKQDGFKGLPKTEQPEENTDRTMVFDSLKDKAADLENIDKTEDLQSAENDFHDTEELDEFDEFEEIDIPEYTSIDDAAEIKTKLRKEKKHSLLRIFSTLAIAAIAFVFSIPAVASAMSLSTATLKILHAVLTAAAVLINLKTSVSLFTQKSFTTSSVVSASALVCTLVGIISIAVNTSSIFLSAAAATVLLVNEIGNYVRTQAVSTGFDRIASSDKKKAVNIIENREKVRAIAGNSIDGEILVGSTKKTVNVTGLMRSAYSPSPFDRRALFIFAAAVIAAAVSAIIVGVMHGNSLLALSVFGLVLCVANAPSFLLTAYLPISKFSKTFSNQCGGMFGGYNSVETLSQCNAAAVDAVDLFPKGTLILSKLHILGMNEIDKTLIKATALSTAAESPLGGMLKKLIGNDVQVFPTAEDVKYEKNMGISGWFKDEHMLIGNRDLMIAHDVALPPLSVDTKILKAGFFPVYIASGSKVCALLITKYIPNERVAFDLQNACNLGLTVCVRSTDPNITAEMISDYFGVYDDSVTVMSKDGAKVFEESSKFSESAEALASFRGSSHALLKTITAACKIKRLVSALGVIGAIISAAAIILAIYLSANPLYQIIAAAVTAVSAALMFIISKIAISADRALK